MCIRDRFDLAQRKPDAKRQAEHFANLSHGQSPVRQIPPPRMIESVKCATGDNEVVPRRSRPAGRDYPLVSLRRNTQKVSLIGLGGYHIGMQEDEKESIGIIRTAIDNGINFMDNCWDYNDGVSEIRMGTVSYTHLRAHETGLES